MSRGGAGSSPATWSTELRSAIDLAELLRDQGQPDKAHELLAPIHRWFSEGFNTPDM